MSRTVPVKTAIKAPAVLFAGLTEAEAGKLAQDAFRVAAWMGQPEDDEPDDCEEPHQFAEALAGAFEMLVIGLLLERGVSGFSHHQAAYGAQMVENLKEVPTGWRPLYAPRRRAEGGRS